jgi:methyl-accepting chemotaxis protein
MSQMKLGTKIILGFGVLILIALLLGGLAAVQMKSVQGESVKLAQEYVPEVQVANNIERYSLLTMYANRGYGYTEEERFLKSGRENLAKVEKYMVDAEDLAQKAKHLVKLKAQVAKAKQHVAAYKGLAEETVTLNQRLAEIRKVMDQAAAKYVKNCNDFLASQNQAMEKEIAEGAMGPRLKERLLKITLVNDIIGLGNATRIGNFKSQAMRSPETMREALNNFPEIEKKFQMLRAVTRQELNIRQINETKAAADQYKEAMEQFLARWLEREELNKNRGQAANMVLDAAQATALAGIGATDEIATGAASSLSTASTIMIFGLLIALVVSIALAILITRSITGPIRRIIEALSSGSEQVSAASNEVSSASQELAEGASENAAALEETSSSLEEMASMTRQNADNATQANSLMDEARRTVTRAGEAMKEMTQSMDDISTSGQEIGKIIKTIDEIAFQTNLLALNAAVEAARAGEAGAGFAVVADEVRNLAMRAAEAAKNTADLIETTVQKINQGNQLVKTTDETFTEVATNANKVAELVSEIAAASQEQAQGIDQVNTAVTQMDTVTQKNAANAEESASASEELNAQAETLMDVVNELVNMVGGAESRSGQMRGRPSAKTDPAHRAALPSAKTKAPAPAPAKGKVVKADEVIPMDDDFSDF